MQERTLISFTEENTLKDNFPTASFKVPTYKVSLAGKGPVRRVGRSFHVLFRNTGERERKKYRRERKSDKEGERERERERERKG